MNTFQTTQSLGQIVATMPKASEVFKNYHIDFCCGGHRSLAQAIQEQNLNEQEVLSSLETAYAESLHRSEQLDFRTLSSTDLIEYVVDTHHAYLNQTLPQISELATKVLRAHGKNHNELFTVHKLYQNLRTELEQHLIKEEELLFPMIKSYEKSPSAELREQVQAILTETEDEHEAAGDVLKELSRITDEYQVPADACPTYKNTYKLMKELEHDLFQHIHLENNILFRRFDIELKN